MTTEQPSIEALLTEKDGKKYLPNWYTGFIQDYPLNPMQELLVPHMDHFDNVLVCGKTSSGKSTALHIFGADDILEGKSILYIASFKALAEEKVDDWGEEGHPWRDIPRTAITGDYTYDAEKIREIEKAQLISITPESLVSVLRNKNSGKANFLKNVSTVFLDEGHLVAESGRGPNMEAAMIEFFKDFPHARLVVLSGTIPNSEEYATWMSRLNNAKTHVVKSEYRPVELKYHFREYAGGSGEYTEASRINKIVDIVETKGKEGQQFLIAVWKKKFGNKIVDHLKSRGYQIEFHSADVKDLSLRKNMERRFKQGTTQILVCTSTLFTGVNLPARNVIVTTMEAGGSEIESFTLQQAAGRAGRPRYDTEGDVYFFVPEKNADYHMRRVREGEPINSQLRKPIAIASHFLGAVYLDRIKSYVDFQDWYQRTLAHVQEKMSEELVDKLLRGIVEDMATRGMIKFENDKIELKKRGEICAQFLLDPYHFSDLCKNFSAYFSLRNPNDLDLAGALTRVHPYYSKWHSHEEKMAVPKEIKTSRIEPEYWKFSAAAYLYLQGTKWNEFPYALNDPGWRIKDDLDRTGAALSRACVECEMWKEKVDGKQVSAEETLRAAIIRVRKGVTWQRARAMIVGFKRQELVLLAQHGIHDIEDARKNLSVVRTLLKPDRVSELGLVGTGGSSGVGFPSVNRKPAFLSQNP